MNTRTYPQRRGNQITLDREHWIVEYINHCGPIVRADIDAAFPMFSREQIGATLSLVRAEASVKYTRRGNTVEYAPCSKSP